MVLIGCEVVERVGKVFVEAGQKMEKGVERQNGV